MKYSWIPLSAESRRAWDEVCPVGEYRVIQASDVPSVVPSALVDKGHSVLIMASGSPSGTAYYMVNINRLDIKDRAIDQEPFGLAFVGEDPVASGCFIHHGTWDGRTRAIPQGFVEGIAASALDSCHAVTSIPSEPAGKIGDLQIASQQTAFHHLVGQLRQFTTHTHDD